MSIVLILQPSNDDGVYPFLKNWLFESPSTSLPQEADVHLEVVSPSCRYYPDLQLLTYLGRCVRLPPRIGSAVTSKAPRKSPLAPTLIPV
jgi:hypothetical protein